MSTLLWVAFMLILVTAIILSVVLTNRRNKRHAASRAAADLGSKSAKLTGDPGLYVMRDTLNIVEMPSSDVRGLALESSLDDTIAHLMQEEGHFLTVSHTEEWAAEKTVRLTSNGDVYAVDSDGVIVHGVKHKGRRVELTGRLDKNVAFAIVDNKCTLGGSLRVKAAHPTVSGSFLAYTLPQKAYFDQVTPTGIVSRGLIKAPGTETFQSAMVSNTGLCALVVTKEYILSFVRPSVDVNFERTGVSANLGSIETVRHNADLSVVAVQSHMKLTASGGTNVLIYAWDTAKNHLGDVPRILNSMQGQTLQQVKGTHVYVKTTSMQSQRSCINVYGPIREFDLT